MESIKNMKAYYSRFGIIEFEEVADLEEGIDFLLSQENEGNITALGVYEEKAKIIHFIENLDIWGEPREEILKNKLLEFKKIGIETNNWEFIEKR